MRKRLLAVLLTVSLLAAMLVVPAAAVDVGNFTDLNPNGWYYPYVDWATAQDCMIGMTDTTFEPNTNLSRAMFATLIARYDGVDTFGAANDVEAPFDDVASGKWYTAAVAWAKETGVVKGTSETTFDPSGEITRQEMAVMLNRYIRYFENEYDEVWKFTEDPVVVALKDMDDFGEFSDWAKEDADVEATIQKGVMIGVGDNTFLPKAKSTRAEAATVMYRLAWGLSNDLLHQAVQNSKDMVNAKYDAYYEQAKAIVDADGDKYLVFGDGDAEVSIPDTLPEPPAPGEAPEGYYDIVATAKGELDVDGMNKIIAVAAYYATRLVTSHEAAGEAPEGYTVSAVYDTVVDVADAFGIEIEDQTARQIAEQVWALAKSEASDVWQNFTLGYTAEKYPEQVYLFDNVVIKADGKELMTFHTNNGTGTTITAGGEEITGRQAAKKLAYNIAVQLHKDAQAKYAGEITTAVDLQAKLDLQFNDLAVRTRISYPNYTLTMNLSLDSKGAVGYQYKDGKDNYYVYGAMKLANAAIDAMAEKIEKKVYDSYAKEVAGEDEANEEQIWNMTYAFEAGTDPDQLVEQLLKRGVNLDDYSFAGKKLSDYSNAATGYILAAVADWMNDKAVANGVELTDNAATKPAAGWAAEKKADFIAWAESKTLGTLAEKAKTPAVQEEAAKYGHEHLHWLVSAINNLPKSAEVAFAGTDVAKTDLENLKAAAAAKDPAATLAAAADLVLHSNVADKTLADLEDGVTVTINWRDYDYTAVVHLVIE